MFEGVASECRAKLYYERHAARSLPQGPRIMLSSRNACETGGRRRCRHLTLHASMYGSIGGSKVRRDRVCASAVPEVHARTTDQHLEKRDLHQRPQRSKITNDTNVCYHHGEAKKATYRHCSGTTVGCSLPKRTEKLRERMFCTDRIRRAVHPESRIEHARPRTSQEG